MNIINTQDRLMVVNPYVARIIFGYQLNSKIIDVQELHSQQVSDTLNYIKQNIIKLVVKKKGYEIYIFYNEELNRLEHSDKENATIFHYYERAKFIADNSGSDYEVVKY